MGKNLVVRLHVYLMCFLLAFSPAYVYASAAPVLDFTGVVNGVKTAGGYAADFIFKRSANDPNYNAANDDRFDSKNHEVSNKEMGKVWKFRWANPALGLTAGVAAVEALLLAADWILDPANNRITKIIDASYIICGASSYVPDNLQRCSKIPAEAFDLHFNPEPKNPNNKYIYDPARTDTNALNTKIQAAVDSAKKNNITRPTAYTNFTLWGSQQITDTDGKVTTYTNRYVSAFIVILPEGVQEATEDDIAEAVAKASPQVLEQLATPASATEPHAPTAAAAAKAEPTPATCPAGQTKVNGVCKASDSSQNKCPAGQIFDAETKQCKSATASKCPIGQVYDPVKKKCKTPLPDDDDPEPEGEDWPEFCEWAAPVCDFIEWAKQDVDKFEVEKVDVEDTADDAQSITSQILTLGYVSGGVKSCPSDLDLSFEFMGQSIGFELSYAPLCEMLLTARPVVIAIAYFQAAKIVFVGRRD